MSGQDSSPLHRMLAGDATQIATVRNWLNDDFDGIDRTRAIVLEASAVVRVLQLFKSGEISEDGARTWAEFMRSGCFDGDHPKPAESLWIDWSEANDDEIATALMRLSELGDIVDGEFRPGEIDQLIAALQDPT